MYCWRIHPTHAGAAAAVSHRSACAIWGRPCSSLRCTCSRPRSGFPRIRLYRTSLTSDSHYPGSSRSTLNRSPALVGVGPLVTATLESTKLITELVRRHSDAKTVMGGPSSFRRLASVGLCANTFSGRLLCLPGDGERPLAEIWKALSTHRERPAGLGIGAPEGPEPNHIVDPTWICYHCQLTACWGRITHPRPAGRGRSEARRAKYGRIPFREGVHQLLALSARHQ